MFMLLAEKSKMNTAIKYIYIDFFRYNISLDMENSIVIINDALIHFDDDYEISDVYRKYGITQSRELIDKILHKISKMYM